MSNYKVRNLLFGCFGSANIKFFRKPFERVFNFDETRFHQSFHCSCRNTIFDKNSFTLNRNLIQFGNISRLLNVYYFHSESLIESLYCGLVNSIKSTI